VPTTPLHSPSNPLQDPTFTLLKLWPRLSAKRLQVAGVQSVARLLPTARSRCGIYVLSFSNGEYYVGRTVNFMNRFQAHRRNHGDITEVFFYRKAKRDLVRDEYAATNAMQVAGLLLRGAGVDVGGNLQGSSVFDEMSNCATSKSGSHRCLATTSALRVVSTYRTSVAVTASTLTGR
jgi:hypothetical protein